MFEENSAVPFFFEQVEGKSLSSTFTEGLLHFILQKNDRLAPEQSLDGPGAMSVFTGRPATNTHTHTHNTVNTPTILHIFIFSLYIDRYIYCL